jgi:hypothetical protein
MSEDLRFVESLVDELQEHITRWDSDKVIDKTSAVFESFNRRFLLEDFLILHVQLTEEMRKALKHFLEVRKGFRKALERILSLHVDEVDFRSDISNLHVAIFNYMSYLKTEFEPSFIDQINPAQMSALEAGLEKKARLLSFS